MKRFILGFAVTIVLLPAGSIAYLRLGAAEVRADVEAPAWQSWLMHRAVHAAVRRRASAAPSPSAHGDQHGDQDLIAGGKLYLDGCAGCHGKPGRPPRARAEFFPPPELAHAGTDGSGPELFWIVKHGIRRTGMSAYGPFYSDRQIWALVEFVERMRELPPSVLEALRPKLR